MGENKSLRIKAQNWHSFSRFTTAKVHLLKCACLCPWPFFKILPPPWCTVGRERHKLKNKERQRGDRDTNWRLDKSQREEMILCSPWLCELEFFYLEWGPLSQALTGRVSCHVCKHGGWEIGRLASWQKDPVVWVAYGSTDADIWILFARSTLRQAWLCQGESKPFDFYSHGLL